MADAIIISDLHLGSDPCRAKPLLRFLSRILEGELSARELILNGDVFDSHDFRRLRKSHWKILSIIRKLSKRMEVTWIEGNHDGPADSFSHLLGVEVDQQKIIVSGGRRVLILHGHIFDKFITQHPIMTWFGDLAYELIQKIDPSCRLAKRAKHASKTFLRVQEKIKHDAIRFAQRSGCDAVCCGHTHQPAALSGEVGYYNSGCWTEPPGSYLTIADGEIELHDFEGGFDADDQDQFQLADDPRHAGDRARDVFVAHGLGYGQGRL